MTVLSFIIYSAIILMIGIMIGENLLKIRVLDEIQKIYKSVPPAETIRDSDVIDAAVNLGRLKAADQIAKAL